MLPKNLLNTTSPLVESIKIIDSIKNDRDKFDALIENVCKKDDLFYSMIAEDMKKKYNKALKKELLDTVCKVMIKEKTYENQKADS